MADTIRTLYVTLKRSFAGTPDTMVRTLKALGLKRLHQTVRKENNARVRGALMKVRHLVLIETDALYEKRRLAEREAVRLRDPVFVKHSNLFCETRYECSKEQDLLNGRRTGPVVCAVSPFEQVAGPVPLHQGAVITGLAQNERCSPGSCNPGVAAPYGILRMSHLRDWFVEVDSNRDGFIDANELDLVLRKAAFKFENRGIAAQMIRLHDQDNSGTIDFGEFEKLHDFLVELQHKFTSFDRDKSSWLTPDEAQEAIAEWGFQLDQHAFMRLMNAFDSQRKGQLKLGDFISMILFLKSCSKIFQAFDRRGCGRIVLNYDQFIYALGNASYGCQTMSGDTEQGQHEESTPKHSTTPSSE